MNYAEGHGKVEKLVLSRGALETNWDVGLVVLRNGENQGEKEGCRLLSVCVQRMRSASGLSLLRLEKRVGMESREEKAGVWIYGKGRGMKDG